MSWTEAEKFENIRKATLLAKAELTVESTEEDWKRETNEHMLRLYIYGDMKKRKPCTIMKKLVKGKIHAEKDVAVPVAFATSLVEHVVRCEECAEFYDAWIPNRGS